MVFGLGKKDERKDAIRKEAKEAEKEAYYTHLKAESVRAAQKRGAERAKKEATSGTSVMGSLGGFAQKAGKTYAKAGEFAAPIAKNFDDFYSPSGSAKGKRRKKSDDPYAGFRF